MKSRYWILSPAEEWPKTIQSHGAHKMGLLMKSIPVSKFCPTCGEKTFRKVRPNRWIAFSADRVCKECETQYSPITPRWAAGVFIILGLLFAVGGAAALVICLIALVVGRPDPGGLFLSGCCIAIGIASLLHGIRAIVFNGRV
jgi:hypothetical protein